MSAPIAWPDFEKVEMRAGTILSANDFPRARKPALRLSIDFGTFGVRETSAQVAHYNKEALVGRQVIAVLNFPPKNIAGFMSQCLVLGVYDAGGKVVLLHPSEPVANGSLVG